MKLALLLATLTAVSSGQSDEWVRALDQARQLTKAGNYPAAQRQLTQLAKQAEASGSPAAAIAWHDLGSVDFALGNLHSAERAYRRCLELRRGFGDDLDDARVRSSLGAVVARLGKYADAEALFESARVTFESKLGPDHLDYGAVLNNQAFLRQLQGRYADAAMLMRRAAAIFSGQVGPAHRSSVIALSNLALVCAKLGQGSEAEELSNRAVTSIEKLVTPDHPLLADLLFLRADVLKLIGNKKGAANARARAMEVRTAFLRDTGAGGVVPAEELRVR